MKYEQIKERQKAELISNFRTMHCSHILLHGQIGQPKYEKIYSRVTKIGQNQQ